MTESEDELEYMESNPLGGSSDGNAIDQDSDLVRESAMELFTTTDFVVEPQVLSTISRYFQAGGEPEPVVTALCDNYHGLAQVLEVNRYCSTLFFQMCNLMGEWLLQLEDRPDTVQEIFEQALSQLIFRHFDPKQADRIFDQSSEGTGIDWLPGLIAHSPWRLLVYSLATSYPNCLMLNFAVKLISDAGYQHEISNVTTAAQQLEIFSRVLTTAVEGVLIQHRKGPATDAYEQALRELIRVVCHSEHTFIYTQTLLTTLERDDDRHRAVCSHLRQTLRIPVHGLKGQELASPWLALLRTIRPDYSSALNQAILSMLSKNALNPADISVLYQQYTDCDPPPSVIVLRDPILLQLLVDALFQPKGGGKIHVDHRPKYVYLLAYASCVAETEQNGRLIRNREELDTMVDELDRMSRLCQERGTGGGESSSVLVHELPQIFYALKFVCVAAGLLHWIGCSVVDPDFFQLHPDPVPIHLALLDEIATNHACLHPKVFRLLTTLFGSRQMSDDGTLGAAELLMDRQRTLIDRLVHLLSVGFALPVTEFVVRIFKEGQADVSLVRYFAMETLEIVSPPFSQDFIDVFLPLVENAEIFDDLVHEKIPEAKEFIEQCRTVSNVHFK